MEKYTITKRQAIRECKKMWKLITKSCLGKYEWFKTDASIPFSNKYMHDCPLCEYTNNLRIRSVNTFDLACRPFCPLYIQLNEGCLGLNYMQEDTTEFYNALLKLKC